MEDKVITDDPVLNYFMTKYPNEDYMLRGGAVVDIVSGNTPKDYDFTILSPNIIKDLDFEYSSNTADTFSLNIKDSKYIIQLLKTDPNEFTYTISKCYIRMKKSRGESYLVSNIFNNNSFKTKKLIPTSYSENMAFKALQRFPHWKNKGYYLPEETYLSLLNAAFPDNRDIIVMSS